MRSDTWDMGGYLDDGRVPVSGVAGSTKKGIAGFREACACAITGGSTRHRPRILCGGGRRQRPWEATETEEATNLL